MKTQFKFTHARNVCMCVLLVIETYVISTEIACTDLFIVYSKTCPERRIKKTKNWISRPNIA